MKVEKNAWYMKVCEKLRLEAGELLKDSSDEISFSSYRQFMEHGDRQEYESYYFQRRKRLATFGLHLYLYPEEKKYIDALENEIWQVCNEFTWCLSAHVDLKKEEQSYQNYKKSQKLKYTIDLFAAETAFTLAEMLSLFELELDSFLIERMKIEVDRRVFTPFRNNHFHWEKATHNWAAVCAGSIGSAALYIMDDGKEQEHILNRAIQAIDCYLEGFEKDGACAEGYGYWQYGFGYFVYFADLLRKHKKIDLFKNPKIEAIAKFQEKIFLAHDNVMNFSDAEPKAHPRIGFSHYLHQLFSTVHVPLNELGETNIVDHCGRFAPAIRELWWFDITKSGKQWPVGNYLLGSSEIFIARRKVKDTRYAFSVKGGHNAEPHNHNDIGHFILFAGDTVFLSDLGSGQYNKDYFSEERYKFICNSAAGHSIPIINGNYQQEGKQYVGKIIEQVETNDYDQIRLDLNEAYPDPSLLTFHRTFTWEKCENQVLLLQDSFHFSTQPRSLVESFIIKDLPHELIDGEIFVYGKKNTLKISFSSDLLTPTIERKNFINHQGSIEYFLHVLFDVLDANEKVIVDVTFEILDCEVN